MGARTAILAFVDNEAIQPLSRRDRPTAEAARRLVGRVHPDRPAEQVNDAMLGDEIWPDDDHTYVAAFAGAELVCDRRFAVHRPSRLPSHLLELAAGRRVLLHAMHSVSDSLAIAAWEGGRLRRALSVSPSGVVESIGSPLAFEAPYWGDHMTHGAASVPFHPLELGEAALRAWFGFALEGDVNANQIDPYDLPMYGFRTADPTGAEQAARQSLLEQFLSTHTLHRYTIGSDGRLVEKEIGGA